MAEKKIDVATLGWKVPADIREMFVAFCEKVGSGVQDAAGGALLVWIHLPPDLREQAIQQAKDQGLRDDTFWRGFSDGVARESRSRAETREGKRRLAGGKR